jgi:2-oxoacid:acceptor oxidoreductase gamma subunit (pyruvate/2-ketoisovalerate family)
MRPTTIRALEVRLHGRGGQGGVTCAKILAAVWAGRGKSVQSFGDYAGERSGAPVRAYVRVADEPISDRNKVYRPDHLIVLDPTLLTDDVVTGLAPGGTLLVNTTKTSDEVAMRFPGFVVATVDATSIARRHGIGTRSVVIVNTTIAGAFVRAMGLPLAALEEAYARLGFASNFPAAREAYETVDIGDAPEVCTPSAASATPAAGALVLPLVEHREGLPPPTRTGSWRTQSPRYVRNLAPCNAVCPAGNDVVGFLQAAAHGDVAAAAAILGRTTPFAAVCGRICDAACERNCNRGPHDGAVNVRGVERFVADRCAVAATKPAACSNPKRVAVVGGGPAGLSAAYALARLGHRPTVFEGTRELGGRLRSEVPPEELPRDVLDREIADIVELGVAVLAGLRLSADEVADLPRNFDAVVVATGPGDPPTPSAWTLLDGQFKDGHVALPVFAAGGVVAEGRSIAAAVGDGRRAAMRALAAAGVTVSVPAAPDLGDAVRPEDIQYDHFPHLARAESECGGEEAKRCLSCGKCTQCDSCLVYCPEGVIRRRGNGYVVDLSNCKGCGVCVTECPRKAMEMSAS